MNFLDDVMYRIFMLCSIVAALLMAAVAVMRICAMVSSG